VNSLFNVEDVILRKVQMQQFPEREKFTILLRLQLIRRHIAEHHDDMLKITNINDRQ